MTIGICTLATTSNLRPTIRDQQCYLYSLRSTLHALRSTIQCLQCAKHQVIAAFSQLSTEHDMRPTIYELRRVAHGLLLSMCRGSRLRRCDRPRIVGCQWLLLTVGDLLFDIYCAAERLRCIMYCLRLTTYYMRFPNTIHSALTTSSSSACMVTHH